MSLHIDAKPGDIAETILLPGDPLRAKFVAENMLENVICYNKVRAMYGYTGTYKGKRISIQGTGMGMPSVSIYVNELINFYQVKKLIRVGTCGAINENLPLGQVILATSASGDSSANRLYFKGMDFAPTADFSLLQKALKHAKKMKIKTLQGGIFSTDTFYDDHPQRWKIWSKHGIMAVEMESQILYTLAARFGAKALSILTVSDNIITGKTSSALEREQSYTDMMKIALELAD